MNLARHIQLLWRFRRVVATGMLIGLVLAFLAAYKVPSMERRGSETWSAESDIFVTQSGFPWGRVTLGDTTTGSVTDGDDESTPFADPARFSTLALLYSNLALYYVVRNSLPERPSQAQISTRVLDATGNAAFLPIIKLTTVSNTAPGAVQLNEHLIEGLTRYLERQQREANTPTNERVQLSVLNEPKGATLMVGRSMTLPLLAFMLCLLAAIAVAHVLENLRPRDASPDAPEDNFMVGDLEGEYAPPSYDEFARNGGGRTPVGDRSWPTS